MNKVDSFGRTPLFIASLFGEVNVAELLLGHRDIMVNKANNEGITPLSVADASVKPLLRAKLSRLLADNPTCIICLDREPDVALVPCGHMNLCGACAYQWNEEKKGCPTDREKILKILNF